MVKRCIGIDISPSGLRAVQVERVGREFHIEKAFAAPTRRSTDSRSDILRSLFLRHGFDRRADIAVSVSPDAVFFRSVQVDAGGLEQIRKGDLASLAQDFPIGPEKIVAQTYSCDPLPDGRFSVTIAATARESVNERLDVLASARARVCLMETSVLAISAATAVNHPEATAGRAIIAAMDERHITLAVCRDGNILIVRNIATVSVSPDPVDEPQLRIAELLAREARITFQKAFGEGISPDTQLYLVVPDAVSGRLKAFIEENLRCRAVVVDPYAVVRALPGREIDLPVCIAEGLALRVLAPELTRGVNFIEAYNSGMRGPLDLKKELRTCAALGGAIVVFLLLGLFAQVSYMEAGYKELKKRITEVFQAALPDEKNVVDPLVQMEQKLEVCRKDYQLFNCFYPAALGPMQVLSSVSASTSAETKLKVEDLLIAADSVRITGTCDSFDAVYQWKRRLQNVPGFTAVDDKDVQKDPKTGLVCFTLLLSLAKQEAQ